MPLKQKLFAFILLFRLLSPVAECVFGQKIIWAKQIGASDANANILELENSANGLILSFQSDKALNSGRAFMPFQNESDIQFLSVGKGGEIKASGKAVHSSDSISHNRHLKTISRNGNSYLAYPRSSALAVPRNPEWSLAYLDGNGNRLWDISLEPGIKIAHIILLQDGNCLLAGHEQFKDKEKDIWFAIFDNQSKKLRSRKLGGKSDDEALTACQDIEGNLFIAGYCAPDSTFLGNSQDLSGRDKDGFIACFDMDFNEIFFYRQRGLGHCQVEKLVSLPDGHLVFASNLSGRDWKLPPFGFPKIGKKDIVLGMIDPISGKENDNALRIFPNPAREILYFSLQKPVISGKAKARLHKKDGSVLQEIEIKAETGLNYRFNVGNTSPGTYYLTIKSGKKEISERVQVE